MKQLENFAKSDAGKLALYASGALTMLFEGVETFVLIPKVQKEADGKMIFDLSFMNSQEKMQEFLDALTDKGTDLYRNTLLKTDNVFPLIYSTFFALFLTKFGGKTDWKTALPYLMLCFDYTENFCSTKMLKSGEVSKSMALFANTMTKGKMLTMTTILNLMALTWWNSRKD